VKSALTEGTSTAVAEALIPVGKVKCYITGQLRQDAPEEQVRQRVARSLVEEYGYSKSDVGVEFRLQMGSRKKPVDLAIFQPSAKHEQVNVILIAETKREEIKPSDRDNGVAQLHSYMAACPNANWALWFGSELRAFRKVIDAAGHIDYLDEPDIPPFGKAKPRGIQFAQLIPAESLKPVFRRIHNYIYANQGLPKDQAFQELLKLIFAKVYDEETTRGEMRFDIDADERLSVLGQKRLRGRIEELFARVKGKFPYIFEAGDAIRLNDRVLAYAVSELRRYSLLATKTDVKGEAYQELVRDNLRGDRGEFFTPDNVCAMAARIVFDLFPEDQWPQLRVLDPACGTGGFLRGVMNVLRRSLVARESAKADAVVAEIRAADYLRQACERSLFGIDINPLLVRAAQMNLVMHGDGSSNVYQGNALLPAGEMSEDIRRGAPLGSFDIVLTNPPFGAGPGLTIDDAQVLDQFTLPLAGVNDGKPRSKMPPEHLFIERCWQFLKPDGVLAIVMPDSILSNPGLDYIRLWIHRRFWVIASIDLPLETFVAFGGTGTQTSVLVLRKKADEVIAHEKTAGLDLDYEAFISVPRTMGFDRRGNDKWRQTDEGEVIWETVVQKLPDGRTAQMERRLRDDEVSDVADAFEAASERATGGTHNG